MKANKIRMADLKKLFNENRMLMKKGRSLNTRTISLLENRHIQFVHIQSDDRDYQHVEASRMSEKMDEQQSAIALGIRRYHLDYSQILEDLRTDIRYGHALKDVEDINYVRNLFEKYMENNYCRDKLVDLEKHDSYSYMHAIDVFTLCTLFAKKEGIQNLEHYAIRFLFHDIGKLKSSSEIFKKGCRESNEEFTKKRKYTQDGYKIFCELELQSVAYLAKLQHEHKNRSGFTEELTAVVQSKEILIFQLIDRYSAITLKNPYFSEIGAAKAITIMYKEEELIDKKLLARFVDFIGIYPENAIVLLSDGSHAVVESVNNMYPLMPTIKRLDMYKPFILSLDFRLNIHKMLSLFIGKFDLIFSELWEYLILGKVYMIDIYCQKLNERYGPFECFTKIYIPIWEIINIMKDNEIVDEVMFREVQSKIKTLLTNSDFQLNKSNENLDVIIMLVNRESRTSVPIQLLEGLFRTKGIYPFLLDLGTNEHDLQKIMNFCDVSAICMISREYEPIQCLDRNLNLYYIAEHQLDNFIFSFAGEDYREVDMALKLKEYKAVNKLLV